MDRSRIIIADVAGPRGVKGELTAYSLTDVPGRLEQLKSAQVRLLNGADRAVTLESCWSFKDRWILKFAGVDTMDAANEFRQSELWVPPLERGTLPPGEFFQSDLVGCELKERASGRPVGVVEGWQQYGGPPLMVLTVNEREALIPFVSRECDVDLNARVILMDLPEGILDL